MSLDNSGASEGGGLQESAGTQESSNVESGGSSESGSFDFGSWDGARDSLPGTHHAMFDALQQKPGPDRESETNKKLQDYLRAQIYEARQQEPVQRQEADGSSDPLTREEAMQLFRQEEADKKQRNLVDNFRSSMLDAVGKPQKYGDATVAFASESEVDDFRKFVGETLNGGLTAQDMLLLFRRDDILRQNRDSAVKGFERKLNTNRPSSASGDGVETRSSSVPAESGSGRPQKSRAPRTAELLQANNPELYNAIVNGKTSLF
mgnify:CR=1 FL=1